jgi:hypothetical protein
MYDQYGEASASGLNEMFGGGGGDYSRERLSASMRPLE